MKLIHLSILICTAVVIILVDHQGFQWMRGIKRTLDARAVRTLHRSMWLGFIGMVTSGSLMFLPAYQYYLLQPFFITKLCFIAAIGFNGILIGRLQHVATERPFSSLMWDEKVPLFASGAISTAGWVAVACIGLFLLS